MSFYCFRYPDGETRYYAYDNSRLLKAAWGEKRGNRYEDSRSLPDAWHQRCHLLHWRKKFDGKE
ncbi:MAG TPA: hypothetical protein VI298_05315 [Geobacteraceae bacterium]